MPRKMQARCQFFRVQRNGFFLFFNELGRMPFTCSFFPGTNSGSVVPQRYASP